MWMILVFSVYTGPTDSFNHMVLPERYSTSEMCAEAIESVRLEDYGMAWSKYTGIRCIPVAQRIE